MKTRRRRTGKVTRLGPRLRTYAGEPIDGPLLTVTVSLADIMALVDVPPRPALTEGAIVEDWQDRQGRPKQLGDVWSLTKGTRTARCELQGHPIGTEARVLVENDVISTKAFRDTKALVDDTAAWRAAYEAKGWRAADGT